MFIITEAIFNYACVSVVDVKIPAIRCLLEQRDYYLKYEQYSERVEMEKFLQNQYNVHCSYGTNQIHFITAFCLALKDYYFLNNDEVAKLFAKSLRKKVK